MKYRILKSLVACAAWITASGATAAELADTARIDAYLAAEMADRGIPGLVALVVDEDEILYLSAHGRRDVGNDQPMTPDATFRLASMTKPIAATAIMMLVEEGKLSLDDLIRDHDPSFADVRVLETFNPADGSFTTRPAARPITLRHLLSHSSGLAYGFASDEITRFSADGLGGTDLPLLYDPGDGWSYAGGIAVVGRVLEKIEGVGLDAFLRERLFEPLGMNDTFYVVPADRNSRVVTTHQRDESGTFVESPNPDEIRSAVGGDGGLHSTASDYAKFIQLILNDGMAPNGQRLVSRATVAELGRNQLGRMTVGLMDEPTPALARAFPLGAGRDGFGLGFQVTGAHDEPGVRAPGSMSWAGIYNTEFWIDPANGIGAVLLMQFLPFYDADAIEVLQGFEAAVYAELVH